MAKDTYWLELEAPEIARRANPGEFLMIGFGTVGYAVPFLPRPNSIAAADGDTIGLLIRVYGAGSRRLSLLRPDDQVLVLGPLGVGFRLDSARRVLCVAGGVGLAPFIMLPPWIRESAPGTEVHLLYGEREASAVFDTARLRALTGIDAEIWTEDGGLGRRGRVTDGMDLSGVDLVLTCGPTPMLKEVARLARAAGVACQLALEEHMACGMGTCIGCVIEVRDPETGETGYARACIEGPVFPAERLPW